ncbi:MAG TPA: polyribonucleotide nucleotidyltransferase, partial [Ruminococcaceae bacterium]|nr:polyribonucleotide nucleotidyltransferase [Oscillospiraceae bacterium]
LHKTHAARAHILDEVMLKCIPAPREELSKYAPKMLTTKIEVDKIREVIGSGGKVIQKICADCNVKIDVEEDGRVFISSTDIEDAKRAMMIVETIA